MSPCVFNRWQWPAAEDHTPPRNDFTSSPMQLLPAAEPSQAPRQENRRFTVSQSRDFRHQSPAGTHTTHEHHLEFNTHAKTVWKNLLKLKHCKGIKTRCNVMQPIDLWVPIKELLNGRYFHVAWTKAHQTKQQNLDRPGSKPWHDTGQAMPNPRRQTPARPG